MKISQTAWIYQVPRYLSLLDANPGIVEYPIRISDIERRTTELYPSCCVRPAVNFTPKSRSIPLKMNRISNKYIRHSVKKKKVTVNIYVTRCYIHPKTSSATFEKQYNNKYISHCIENRWAGAISLYAPDVKCEPKSLFSSQKINTIFNQYITYHTHQMEPSVCNQVTDSSQNSVTFENLCYRLDSPEIKSLWGAKFYVPA